MYLQKNSAATLTWGDLVLAAYFAGKYTKKRRGVVTDLKDDDEGQPGSQDMPELQGEFIWNWAPGRCSVVSVPAVPWLVAVRAHVKHRQAAVHVASQTPESKEEKLSEPSRRHFAGYTHALFWMLTHPRGDVPCPCMGHIWRRKQSGGCSRRWWQWQRRWWWLPARRYLRESHARYLTAKSEDNKHYLIVSSIKKDS